jgi:hypothetical protein
MLMHYQSQAALPWEKCVAEMWTKDRQQLSSNNSSGVCEMATFDKANANKDEEKTTGSESRKQHQNDVTRVVKIMKQNEPLVSIPLINITYVTSVRKVAF